MDRYRVTATPWADSPPGAPVIMSPELLERLGLTDGGGYFLKLGLCEAWKPVQSRKGMPPDQIHLPPRVADQLHLKEPVPLSAARTGDREVTLGPVLGILISRFKLQELQAGQADTVYCRYVRYAREVSGLLCFFTVDGLNLERKTVRGYLHQCSAGACGWVPAELPVPAVVYDRAFGPDSKSEAHEFRKLAQRAGIRVINQPVKIAKLQVFQALSRHPELRHHLPLTARLTFSTLANAAVKGPDIYLKPNALSKAKGVYRLKRDEAGWALISRDESGNQVQPLGKRPWVALAQAGLFEPSADYTLQEGLDLAAYLGNRFDFRSLVQKNGRGQWEVTGVSARIAPVGGAVTGPRVGGQVTSAERALADAFPDRWEAVLEDLKASSIRLAEAVEQELGTCAELGLDLAVTRDGSVKLIEVNGRPLKVSLNRWNDPGVCERINRYPIHYAAYLAMGGEER